MSAPALAEYSCVACYRLKRKCSKTLPSCALCTRVDRRCEYRGPPVSNGRRSPTPGTSRGTPRSRPHVTRTSQSMTLEISAGATPTTPALTVPHSTETQIRPGKWFLDSVATRGSEMEMPASIMWADLERSIQPPSLEEAQTIMAHHFITTHEWLPVVSRRRLTRQLERLRSIVAADLTALLFAMQLLSSPSSGYSQTVYRTVKTVLSSCEQHNCLSTHQLAAQVLIATFEMSAGMFPVAYLTIGHCSRLCFALGLHDKKKATQLFGTCDTWTESEQRRRLWWAVIVLDRYVHAGFRFRPLAVSIIPSDEIIPACDDDWDAGELAVNPLLVMSIESEARVAPFARACQAAHLLGKVCQHVNDHPVAADLDMHFQEAAQIQRAVSALRLVIENDVQSSDHPHRFLSAQALSLSALQLLFDVHSCIEVDHIEASGGSRGLRLELQEMAISGSKSAAVDCVILAEEVRRYVLDNPGAVSPFLLHSLYSAAGTFAWHYRETGNEDHRARLSSLRDILGQLKDQWPACIDYLDLLKDTEFTYTGANFQ